MVNNDITAPREFVSRLVAPFFEPADPGALLFAVGAKTVDCDRGAPNQLCMTATWRRGGIGSEWSDPTDRCEVTYAQGGAAAYDRERFLRLRGFDPIFHPGYWEDYDIAYRACKAGWRVVYEPTATANHRGKESLRRLLGRGRLEQVVERNRLWFNWLNLDDRLLLCRHFLAIPWIYGRDLVRKKGTNGIKGFFRAVGGAAKVWRTRRDRRRSDPPAVRSDRELMGLDAK